MKYIITEQQYQKLNKSSESLSKAIEKYMNLYISDGNRKVSLKTRSYGNLVEDWCVNGKETVSAIYFFNKGRFEKGSLRVSKEIVKNISKTHYFFTSINFRSWSS